MHYASNLRISILSLQTSYLFINYSRSTRVYSAVSPLPLMLVIPHVAKGDISRNSVLRNGLLLALQTFLTVLQQNKTISTKQWQFSDFRMRAFILIER